MPFKPVLLWTDALIFLLLAAVLLFVRYVRRREHLHAPWQRVMGSRVGMASSIVLAVYLAVGLMDSLHFQLPLPSQNGKTQSVYDVEVLSVLDYIATPLREHVEKTYSAPFATHLYAKETIPLPGGGTVRDYPRLQYGGAHLADPLRDRAGDIAARTAWALLGALALWVLAAVLLTRRLARRQGVSPAAAWHSLWRREQAVPWHVALLTLGVLLLFLVPAAALSVKYHIFGTDKVGLDVFYLSLKSIRTGLVIGTLTTLVMLPFALLLGIMAGYFRGWVDDLIQYLYTTLNSIPGVLLIAASVLMMQVWMESRPELFDTVLARADMRLLFLCIILGVTSWTGLCRLLRGETLKLREMEYIQAAQAFGIGHGRIIARHILPNVMHIVLITVVMDFSGLVLAEAVLSYVGVGVDPSMQSWGNMINSARLEMAREPVVWWSLAAAFLFMFVLVLCANLFADAVRDAFDPRTRR
ncbi:MAG: ABC transporter permease [Sulfuricellaceae bacterium]|nr:ABC transporter permease [Sulfuricellaceae bacterium]